MARLSVRVAQTFHKVRLQPLPPNITRGSAMPLQAQEAWRARACPSADQVKMGTWNIKVRRSKLQSQFGEDITGSLGLDLQKAKFASRLRTTESKKMRGRERRGKKGLGRKGQALTHIGQTTQHDT